MNLDGRLAKRVELVDPTQLHEALDRLVQVVRNLAWLGLGIESQAFVS